MTNSTESRPERSERREADNNVEEVAPGILRIMLPIDLPGLGHVNCYAIEDDRGIALIDPGLADGVSHAVLTERLADVGLDIRSVHTAVATHSHFDHFGGIARLRQLETLQPVAVYGHASFGTGWHTAYDPLLDNDDSSLLEMRDDVEVSDHIAALAARLVRQKPWGGATESFPAEMLATLGEGINPIDVLRPPDLSHVLNDGDIISLGGHSFTALHTPGHADDHVCLWNAELGVLFGGDHMLPTITPHISGFSSYEDPLGEFFASLERIAELEGATIVLPAHGDPFTDVTERAMAIHEHHVGRLDRLREIGTEIGRQPVEGYMKLLFRERSWGSMAASETYAHLEWLRIHGDAKQDVNNGRPSYEL